MRSRFIWRAFKSRFRDSPIEISILRNFVRPTDTVCDIGANKGSFTFWMSRFARRGRVVAFEPQATLADYLIRVSNAVGLTNVTIESKAVSAESGRATFFVPGDSVSPGATLCGGISERVECKQTEVEVVKLDDYFEPGTRVSALKIDVEGAELGVFQGAKRLLSENQPLLIFECENRHLEGKTVNDVFDYLREWDYDGYFISKRKVIPISEFKAEVHQRMDSERFWDKPGYVNNFVFHPRRLKRSA